MTATSADALQQPQCHTCKQLQSDSARSVPAALCIGPPTNQEASPLLRCLRHGTDTGAQSATTDGRRE